MNSFYLITGYSGADACFQELAMVRCWMLEFTAKSGKLRYRLLIDNGRTAAGLGGTADLALYFGGRLCR